MIRVTGKRIFDLLWLAVVWVSAMKKCRLFSCGISYLCFDQGLLPHKISAQIALFKFFR